MKVFKVERSGFRFLDNSFSTTLLVACILFTSLVVYSLTSISLSHADIVVRLLITSSLYASVHFCRVLCSIASCCVCFYCVFVILHFHTYELCSCSFWLIFFYVKWYEVVFIILLRKWKKSSYWCFAFTSINIKIRNKSYKNKTMQLTNPFTIYRTTEYNNKR